jgi:hypothetical protein
VFERDRVKPWTSFTTRGNGRTAPTCGEAKANTDTLGGRLCLRRVGERASEEGETSLNRCGGCEERSQSQRHRIH